MDLTGLDKNAANYAPLSPISLLARAGRVYPHRDAVMSTASGGKLGGNCCAIASNSPPP